MGNWRSWFICSWDWWNCSVHILKIELEEEIESPRLYRRLPEVSEVLALPEALQVLKIFLIKIIYLFQWYQSWSISSPPRVFGRAGGTAQFLDFYPISQVWEVNLHNPHFPNFINLNPIPTITHSLGSESVILLQPLYLGTFVSASPGAILSQGGFPSCFEFFFFVVFYSGCPKQS